MIFKMYKKFLNTWWHKNKHSGTTYFLSFLFSISRRFRWLMIKLTLYLRFKFTLSDNGHYNGH